MILNYSKAIKIVVSVLCLRYHTIKEKCSKDITTLIVLLWFSVVHYSSLFQHFLLIYYCSWKFYTNLFTLTGEPVHSVSQERNGHVPHLYPLLSEKWTIHYTLMLYSSANHKSTSVIKVSSIYEKHRWFPLCKRCHRMLLQNQNFLLSTKINGTQRRTVVSPWRMHCMYFGMPKATSRAKVCWIVKKNQASSPRCSQVTLVWRFSQSISHREDPFFKILYLLFESVLGWSESFF